MSSFCIPRTVDWTASISAGESENCGIFSFSWNVFTFSRSKLRGSPDLLREPVRARVRQVHEPEVEEVDRLVSPLGELDADRLGLLEAGDRRGTSSSRSGR